MADGPPGARRPRPVADLPPPSLADGAAPAKAWLVALVDAAPLEAVPSLPAADLAAHAPALCAAVLRAVGSDRELERLAPGGEASALAARTGALAGAAAPAGVAAAVAQLRGAVWDLLVAELDPRDARLVAESALRLAHVCDVVLQAALDSPAAGAGAPGPGARFAPPAAVDPLADAASEVVVARTAPERAEPWVAAIARRLGEGAAGGRPFGVLALDADGADRLLAADDGTAVRALAAAEAAIRAAASAGADVVREPPARLWVVTALPDAQAARTLGERLAAAGATATHHGRPLTFSIGLAMCPDDGSDPATLVAHADEGVFAARAAGVRLA
jgi:GGDEF domain-containing protein